MQNVAITESREYTKLQYDNADRLKAVVDEAERQKVVGGLEDVKLADFQGDANSSSDKFARELAGDLQACIDELRTLGELLDGRCGTDEIGQPVAPSTRNLIETLDAVLKIVRELYGSRLEESSGAVEMEGLEGDGTQLVAGDGPIGEPAAPRSQELTREAAFDLMDRLAGFFEKTEPSNPAAFQLRKALRVGSMSLPEILAEAITDPKELAQAHLRLGIDPPSDSKD